MRRTIVSMMLFFFVFGLFAAPKPAQAQFITFDPGAVGGIIVDTVTKVGQFVWDVAKRVAEFVMKEGVAVAYRNGLTIFLNQAAQQSAEWVASGGKGQKPMFLSDPHYFTKLADSVGGELLQNTFSSVSGFKNFNLCDPIDPSIKFKMLINLDTTAPKPAPELYKCSFTKIWENARNSAAKFTFKASFGLTEGPAGGYKKDLKTAILTNTLLPWDMKSRLYGEYFLASFNETTDAVYGPFYVPYGVAAGPKIREGIVGGFGARIEASHEKYEDLLNRALKTDKKNRARVERKIKEQKEKYSKSLEDITAKIDGFDSMSGAVQSHWKNQPRKCSYTQEGCTYANRYEEMNAGVEKLKKDKVELEEELRQQVSELGIAHQTAAANALNNKKLQDKLTSLVIPILKGVGKDMQDTFLALTSSFAVCRQKGDIASFCNVNECRTFVYNNLMFKDESVGPINYPDFNNFTEPQCTRDASAACTSGNTIGCQQNKANAFIHYRKVLDKINEYVLKLNDWQAGLLTSAEKTDFASMSIPPEAGSLDDLTKSFEQGSNPISAQLGVESELLKKMGVEKDVAEKMKQIEGGLNSLTSNISGRVKTPAAYVEKELGEMKGPLKGPLVMTGSAVADAFGIFMSTLMKKLLEKAINELNKQENPSEQEQNFTKDLREQLGKTENSSGASEQCGDQYCGAGETVLSCPSDCGGSVQGSQGGRFGGSSAGKTFNEDGSESGDFGGGVEDGLKSNGGTTPTQPSDLCGPYGGDTDGDGLCDN
ncbi:MAG: hypothetical protein HYW78_04135 [Parcubacteria group bacterium]|nr:hypothetical protein [Parcubacteria group bacterium]